MERAQIETHCFKYIARFRFEVEEILNEKKYFTFTI